MESSKTEQVQEAYREWTSGINNIQHLLSKKELTPDQFRNEHIKVTSALYTKVQSILNP